MTLPDFMNPQSENYDRNWINRHKPLPETVWTRFSNGQIHPTNNAIHLARWIADNGAVVIDAPEQEQQP